MKEAFEMIASITQPQLMVRNTREPHYLLIMDAHGNPLALAPLEKLSHNPFPMEQIRLVDGEGRLLEKEEVPSFREEGVESTFLHLVESALKHLDDPVFLCEHPLTRAHLVEFRVSGSNAAVNCLERARIVRRLLEQAIEELRPAGPVPARSAIPRREWQPYLILYSAYIEGELNYPIMRWLQISEGTFNRTRRRAVQAVARVLFEMDRQAAYS